MLLSTKLIGSKVRKSLKLTGKILKNTLVKKYKLQSLLLTFCDAYYGTLQKRLTVVSGMERSGFPDTNIQLQFREIRFTPFPKQLFTTFVGI